MYGYYALFLLIMLLCSAYCIRAYIKVRLTYNMFQQLPSSSHLTGSGIAKLLLWTHGIFDISVEKIKGYYTDNYRPSKRTINLSEEVYDSDSLTAVAVAAHEVAHVFQEKSGYTPYKIRSALDPIEHFCSRSAFPLVLVGLLLDISVGFGQRASLGFYLVMAGVVLYIISLTFSLVLLCVEFDASRRAKELLLLRGYLQEYEIRFVDRVLDASARTYIISTLWNLFYCMRFFMWLLLVFGYGKNKK